MKPSGTMLAGPFRQVLTMRGLPLAGAVDDGRMERVEEGGILVKGGRVEEVGGFRDLKRKAGKAARVEELEGDWVATPGLVDAHTHLCFAGSRSRDYAMRLQGKGYLEIAKQGGGIWDTVCQTRGASRRELAEGLTKRLDRHLAGGVTSCEVKSGYGLDGETELRDAGGHRGGGETVAGRADAHLPGRPRDAARLGGDGGRVSRAFAGGGPAGGKGAGFPR